MDSEEAYKGYEYARYAVAELLGKVEVEALSWAPLSLPSTSSDLPSDDGLSESDIREIRKEIGVVKEQLGALNQILQSSSSTFSSPSRDVVVGLDPEVKEDFVESLSDITSEARRVAVSFVRLERAGDQLMELVEKKEREMADVEGRRGEKKVGVGAFVGYTLVSVVLFLVLVFKFYVYPLMETRRKANLRMPL